MSPRKIKYNKATSRMEKSQILHRLRQYTEDLYRKPDNDNSMEPIVVSEEEREPDIYFDELKEFKMILICSVVYLVATITSKTWLMLYFSTLLA